MVDADVVSCCLHASVLYSSQISSCDGPREPQDPKSPKISDFSSRPWRNLPPTWAIHMETRRPAHNTPIHMDCVCMVLFKTQEIHVDRPVVGWSAGLHVDRPCGGQISPWPARKVTDTNRGRKRKKTINQTFCSPGSVRFGYGLGLERFERFRFSVLAVLLRRIFLCFSRV